MHTLVQTRLYKVDTQYELEFAIGEFAAEHLIYATPSEDLATFVPDSPVVFPALIALSRNPCDDMGIEVVHHPFNTIGV